MLRILHMIGTLNIGGSQMFVINMYRNIDRSNIQFDFIIDNKESGCFISEIEQMGGRVFYLPKFNGKNMHHVRQEWNRFFKEHPEYKILHSHVRSYASLYLPVAKKHGLKTIIHSHATSNGSNIQALMKNILQVPLRFQADYYMACSQAAGVWLFGRRVCNSKNFRVVKNAIDAEKYIFSETKRRIIREEIGLEDEFVLGYLARVTVAKNPLYVIDVMYELSKLNPRAKLLFVGDGELIQQTKDKVKEVGMEEKVIFLGARTDVENILAAMDYYILPSYWEGLGISLIEAQASGLRCICSEAIQDEAIVTNLVERHSLNEGAEVWAKRIDAGGAKITRKNEYENIRAAGYDIGLCVDEMCKFYQGLVKGS